MTLHFEHSVDVETAAERLAEDDASEIVDFMVALSQAIDSDKVSEVVAIIKRRHGLVDVQRRLILGFCQPLADAAREGGTD